jgi:hypothetical protein
MRIFTLRATNEFGNGRIMRVYANSHVQAFDMLQSRLEAYGYIATGDVEMEP